MPHTPSRTSHHSASGLARKLRSRHRIAAKRWFDGDQLHDGSVVLTIEAGRIVAVDAVMPDGDGQQADLDAHDERLDPQAILVPGFIDTHSHSDFALVEEPGAVGALMQGITTQIIGQCGFSAAPLRGRGSQSDAPDDPTRLPLSRPVTWRGFGDYLEVLRRSRPGVNAGAMVGHNALIRAAGSPDDSRILALAEQALDEGALGVSSGLSYHPGVHSTDDDARALSAVATRAGRPYHTHMRYSSDETLETLQTTIGYLAGSCADATISHVFPRSADTATTVERILATFEASAPDFDRLLSDITVYESGGTPWSHGLPAWMTSNLDRSVQEWATDRGWRHRAIAHLTTDDHSWASRWEQLVVAKVNTPKYASLLGCTLAELGEAAGKHPAEVALDLIANDGHFWVAPPNKRWGDVVALLGTDRYVPMVDGITVDPRKATCVIGLERSWNAYRRYLMWAVEHGERELANALAKLTRASAERFALHDRGRIEVGACADLVVLRPDQLQELSRPEFSLVGKGIDAVMVNGVWAVHDGQILEQQGSGMVLTA